MFLWKAGARDADKLVFALAQEDKHCEKVAELLGVHPMSDELLTDGQQKGKQKNSSGVCGKNDLTLSSISNWKFSQRHSFV